VLKLVIAKSYRSEGGGNPSCLGGWANGFVSSVIDSQWITTPQGTRDDKGELMDGAVRFLRVSGSPWASCPRDDNPINNWC